MPGERSFPLPAGNRLTFTNPEALSEDEQFAGNGLVRLLEDWAEGRPSGLGKRLRCPPFWRVRSRGAGRARAEGSCFAPGCTSLGILRMGRRRCHSGWWALAIPKPLRGWTFEGRSALRAKRMRRRTVRVDRDQSSGRYPNPAAVDADALTPGTRGDHIAGFIGRQHAPRDLTGFHGPPSRASETAPPPAGPQTRRGSNRARLQSYNESPWFSVTGLPNSGKGGSSVQSAVHPHSPHRPEGGTRRGRQRPS